MSEETNVALNYLSKNRAVVTIPALRNLSITLKNWSLPGISLPPIEVPSPFYQKKFAGDKVLYETFQASFLVDSELKNWLSIYYWMIGLGAPEDKSQYREKILDELDLYLTVYSAKNNPIVKFKFIESIPTYLGRIDFTEDITETTPVESYFTLEYLRFEPCPV